MITCMILGPIHSTKISGNSSLNLNEMVIFKKIDFGNFGQPFEVVPFSGNLEFPEIVCSIGHFYLV